MRTCLAGAVFLLMLSVDGPAQDPKPSPTGETRPVAESALDKAKQAYGESRDKLLERFRVDAQAIKKAVASNKKLPEADRTALAAEIDQQVEAVGSLGSPPTLEELARPYETLRSSILDARKKCQSAFDSAAASKKRAGDTEGESAVLGDAEKFLGSPLGEFVPARDQTIAITARDYVGFKIGPIKKGETILLTYVSGKWSCGHNKSAESPDESDNQEVWTCQCDHEQPAQKDVIALVKPGTKKKSFVWCAGRDYPDVFLRLNDSGASFANNRNEGVTYRLQIRRADRTKS